MVETMDHWCSYQQWFFWCIWCGTNCVINVSLQLEELGHCKLSPRQLMPQSSYNCPYAAVVKNPLKHVWIW